MDDKELIDLTEYFDRLYKGFLKLYKIVIALVILIGLLNVVKTAISHRAVYQSSMTVVVSEQDKNILVTTDSTEETNLAFQKVLTSSSMYKIIQNDLQMDYVPATLSIQLVNNTNFMIITSTSSNAEDAYKVIKSVASNYGQLTKLMNDANMIIVEEPQMPVAPLSTPNYLSLFIKGAILGMVISLAIVVIYSLSRNTITKEDHIKDKLHLKSLGVIPYISNKKRSFMQEKQLLITNPRIPSMYKEAYRSISLKLERMEHKVLLVSSTLPNEGKSTISSNIALTLAQKGKKVVLIDFDLRNPSLYNTFRIENTKDHIGNYLDECCHTIKDIICPSELNENLDLILGFKKYENSIEMLSRPITKQLIEKLKEKYDYVILDVPPLLVMHDALAAIKYADASVLVIRQDYVKISEVIESLDELYGVTRNLVGCILNAQEKSLFDTDARGYGYGYRYGK